MSVQKRFKNAAMMSEISLGAQHSLQIFKNCFQIRDVYEKVHFIPYQAFLIYKKTFKNDNPSMRLQMN